MSEEKAKEFLMSLKEKTPDDALSEKAAGAKTEEEQLGILSEVAKEMGYDVSAAAIKKALCETEQKNKDMVPLDDNDLEKVAGGSDYCISCPECKCKVSVKPTGKTDTRWFIFPMEEVECTICHTKFWV